MKFELKLTDHWQDCFDVIKKSNRIYTSVQFSHFVVPINDEEEVKFIELLKYISESVTTVHIKHINFISSTTFERMMKYFSNLNRLKINKLKVNRTGVGGDDQPVAWNVKYLEVLAGVNEEVFKSLVNLGIQSENVTIQCNEKDNVTYSCLFLAEQRSIENLRILGVSTGYYRGNVFKIFQQLSDKNIVFESLNSLTFAWEKNLHIFNDDTNINYLKSFMELQSDSLKELELSLFHVPEGLFRTISNLKIRRLKITCSILTHQIIQKPPLNLKLKKLSLSLGDGSSFNSNLDMILSSFPEIEELGVTVTYEKLYFNSPYLPEKPLIDDQRLRIISDRLKSLNFLYLKNLTMTNSDMLFPSLKTFFFRCQSVKADMSNITQLLSCNPSIEKLHIEFFNPKFENCTLGQLFLATKNLINLTEISILVWYSDKFCIKVDDETLASFQKHFKNLQLIRIIYRSEFCERNSAMKSITENNRIRVLEYNGLQNSMSNMLSIHQDYLQFRREPLIASEEKTEFIELREKRLLGLFESV